MFQILEAETKDMEFENGKDLWNMINKIKREIDNKLKVIQTDLKANIKKKEKLPSEIDQNKPCESTVNSDPSQKVNKPRRSYLLSQIYSKYDQFYDKRK